ncbi:MAG: hypothetical protein NC344_10010 [Bacteroidales bacterium]|nr:hypothetical protein [Bacteroidales bacterium]MCM1148138.1 hypothetical protein [Bacteroidales bacterium]MCM1206554.1 hypothetical protein [Bacillota bacterium]MCM1510544.1 hypothetical protein [Clostridium sp.]
MSDKDFNIKEHFKVPAGYFENLTAQIMANIPDQESEPSKVASKHLIISVRNSRLPYYASSIAASLLITIVAITSNMELQDDTHIADAESGNSMEQYAYTVDEAADYTMFDNQDIYDMITE